MNRRVVAAQLLRVIGALLLVVAAIHLTVTPLVKQAILDRVITPAMMPLVAPPFLLNHVVVGILLIPLGVITIYGAGGIRDGERWAWPVAWAIALTLPALPVALIVLMRGGPFDAIPFRIAEVLVTLSALLMPAALLWARADAKPPAG